MIDMPGQSMTASKDWHIVVGQWIFDHRAVPHVDLFSFTMRGEPWVTSAWLSEVLYLAAFKLAGWPGGVDSLLPPYAPATEKTAERARSDLGDRWHRRDELPHARPPACVDLSSDGVVGWQLARQVDLI
jgi:hypothetical protein